MCAYAGSRKNETEGGLASMVIVIFTFTKRVLGARMVWASMPLRYALTSGIPEPAAAGAMKAQSAEAAAAKTILRPAYARKASRYL